MALAFLAAPLCAHEYHVSIAEAEINAEAATLEVALRVKPEDLEEALAQRHDMERVHLDLTPNVDSLIVVYLGERFTIVEPGKKDGALRHPSWVGMEVTPQAAWLYFEFPLPADTSRLTLRNRIFFEIAAKQANTVNLRRGDQHVTLTFTHETPQHTITSGSDGAALAREVPEPKESGHERH